MANLESMVSRYIVTAAQRGAPYHKEFLSSLEKYSDKHKSEIIIVPISGLSEEDVLHPDLEKYTVTSSYKFCNNFRLEDFPVKPQQIRPLTGLGRFVQGEKSAVVGSPKQHLEVLATSNSDLPKILVTTGALTKPHYNTDCRIGRIAEKDHVYGALLVEIDDNTGEFHYRHIRGKLDDGSFMDLGAKYTPFKAKTRAFGGTVILGDLHVGQTNKVAYKASIELIREVKPKNIVIHDLFNAYSISHHDLGKQIHRARKQMQGKLSLKQELKECGEYLSELSRLLPKDGKLVVVKSNHDEHLNRYLEEGRYGPDAENLYLSSRLSTAMIEGKDPVKEGIKLAYGDLDRKVKFLSRDDDFKVHGIQLGSHGDLGSNGSKGSITSQQINYGRSIVGHRHTPGIRGDAYCVGTLTDLKLDYNRGPSSWLNTNALVNPDGSIQLINIIDGKYKR